MTHKKTTFTLEGYEQLVKDTVSYGKQGKRINLPFRFKKVAVIRLE